ncbi:MAG TPA: type II toxin-antitoxin system HicA family toxin [Candidatus Avalokitesvara rifleensis]|uniref:type II toxin-antitoxin system HicA family toxin n=1 Tax=Candidatus Avalokitesvara rifleensis TaxID=3367620 RepID=UPI0040253A2E
MGERFPSLKPKEVIRAFQRAGFTIVRQKGSHVFLKQPHTGNLICIPQHTKDIKIGLLLSQLKKIEMSKEEFLKLF